MVKFIEHTSIYGADFSDDENRIHDEIYQPKSSLWAYRRYMKNSPKSFTLNTLRGFLKRKIVRWQHYMIFKNVSSLYRIDVC
jgi:hypothetical protein